MNILITGGASGLGASITKELAKNKENKIYITYANSKVKALETCSFFNNVEAIQCDFFEDTSVLEFTKKISDLNLNILINNAFTGFEMKHFHKINQHVFLDSFKANVDANIKITQEVLKGFKKNKKGKILTVLTSYLINKPPVGLSEYVANKAYLKSMVKSWATEFSKYGITSNSISPSFMVTNFTSDTDERIIDDLAKNHPLKELLTTEEVAKTVSFLLQMSKHYNGQDFVLNAGENIPN